MRRYVAVLLLLLALVAVAVIQYQTSVTAQQNQSIYVPLTLNQPTHTPTVTLTPTVEPTATTGKPVGTGVYQQYGDITYFNYAGTKFYGFIYFVDGTPNFFGGENGYRTIGCFDGYGCFGPGFPVDASGYYELSINGPPAAPLRGTGYVYVVNGANRTRVSNNYRFDTRNGTCFRMDFIECAQGNTSAQCTITDGVATQGEKVFAAPEAVLGPCD